MSYGLAVGMAVGVGAPKGVAEALAVGVAIGMGVGINEGEGVGLCKKLIWGICDSLKKREDWTMARVAVSSVGTSGSDISLGTLGSGALVIALYMLNPIHISTVINVSINIVIKLGNLDFCIFTVPEREPFPK